MATYDGLSRDQRAILDLLIRKGQTYGQIADALDMPVDGVRERALEALTDLSPVSAASVDREHRQELADYLLNQQSVAEAAPARGHLRRSESGRAWSRSVLDSLEHLYAAGTLPTIPAAEAGAEPAGRRRERASTPLSPEAQAVVRRRRLIGAGLAALLLALIVLVWPIGVLTGDDGNETSTAEGSGPELIGQVQLRPVEKAGRDRNDAGIALATRRKNGKLEVAIQARIPPSTPKDAYQVWLYDSATENRLLGAQVANAQGAFAGRASLPENYRDYRYIEVSREEIKGEEGHSGETILRGPVSQFARPTPAPDAGGAASQP